MPFRTNRNALIRPVNSVKHVVDTSGVVTAGVAAGTDLINTVDNPVFTSPNNVHVGSKVSSVYLKVEVVGVVAFAGVPRVYFTVGKNPNDEISLPPVDAVGVDDSRKFIIHQEMTMVADLLQTDFPRTMFKGVIRIPRGYQRNGINDKLQFTIGNSSGESTGSVRWCLQCIYKEFY